MTAKAAAGGRRRRLMRGVASKKPRKKRMDGARMYDVLMTCAENCSVHGAVRNHPQISQGGADGSCWQTYHASAQTAPNDKRLSSTNGASGIGITVSGRPTSRACSAPGISLRVQTT